MALHKTQTLTTDNNDRTELHRKCYNLLAPKDSDFAISRLHYRNGEEGYAPSETLG
jgi:hypothetical protein